MIDIAVIGAGAAGLTAAIFAAERAVPDGRRVVVLESARKPGAKILVSGGGRCNVTNESVTPDDFNGASKATIRKVLSEFDAGRTRAWFESLGVQLKTETNGKLFPVTDRAQTVLDALINRLAAVGAELWLDACMTAIMPAGNHVRLHFRNHAGQQSTVDAKTVVIAAGGLALPKSGSDGAVMQMLRRHGHTIVPTTPALAPLVVKSGSSLGGRIKQFSGISVDGHVRLYRTRDGGTRRLIQHIDGAILFTHFGLSGPAPMNLSRHLLREQLDHPEATVTVTIGLSRFHTPADVNAWITEYARQHPKQTIASMLATIIPARMADAMADACGGNGRLSDLTRDNRKALATAMTDLPVDVAGTRGYTFAEATAGGIDLREIDVRSMRSRVIDRFHLCGEILDVDGRIGGFNFQWAWSSGYLAGRGAASSERQ
ncbi:MAG: aminoacetone oxidase family FAD-binding enzyme [Candidatus Zixiibacteriota bacterium]